MSEEFYKESKRDIVEQINAKNGLSITPDNVLLGIVNGSAAIVGDSVKYSQSAPITGTPRDLSQLFDQFPIVVTDLDIDAGTLKVKDLIPVVNKATGANLTIDDITNGEFLVPKPITGAPAVVVNFAGNRITLTNDFNVIIVKKTFSVADWATASNDHVISWLGTTDARNYRYEPDKFSSARIQVDTVAYIPDCQFAILGVGAPIFYLEVSDYDFYSINWPSNVTWIESDIHDFRGRTKSYLFISRDNGLTYHAVRIMGNESWVVLLYLLQSRKFDSSQINYLLDGHVNFLNRNTGQIIDPHTDHYVINQANVLVNNRHFTYNTRQEGQPDSDATTEGQSILIVGFIEAYKLAVRRGDTNNASIYLDSAKKYFAAYISAFYAGVQPPDVPGRWSANWIVNGKAPVLAHYPLADSNDFPTHGGFIDAAISSALTAGVGYISHGYPSWGEYMDVVGKVYDGIMGWRRIDATPYAIDAEAGQIDWTRPANVYEVEEVWTWSMEIIDGDGNKVGTFTDPSQIGKIVLKDKTIYGDMQISYAVRLPVEQGGYMIATNECQHNRPLQVPVNNLFRGNASDAEQWFCEAAYDLWKITGEELYRKAYLASRWTIMEYTAIDANDKFIRQVDGDARYDTDGITYYYTYPSNLPVLFTRSPEGYIKVRSDNEAGIQFTMEQNAIPFRVNRDSILLITYGGVDDLGGAINMRSQLELSIDKTEGNKKTYTIPLTATASEDMTVLRIPIGSLVEVTPNDVFELIYASNVTWSENATITQTFEENVWDDRTAPILHAQGTTAGDMQFSVGLSKKRVITGVIYRTNIAMNIRVIDADGWRWWAMLEPTTEWVGVEYVDQSWTLSSYQTNPETTPRPTTINWGDGVDEVTFLPDGSSSATDYIDLYSLNDVPTTYSIDDGYTMLFNITFYMNAPGTMLLGDCTIQGQRLDPLPYTPGIIPFSNNSVPDAPTFDSWRGQPYPGYQYPFYYALQTLEENPNRDLMIQNVIDFWWDSQQWYYQQFGVMGPGASAYVWDRWDKPSNETPNTWTMYHFGTNVAWSGYQPRAFYSAVKMYETMGSAGLAIPQKLTEYITNWLGFLKSFVDQYGIAPSDYPVDKAPLPVANDFTGHMSGLYLAGISKAYLLGIRIPGQIELARKVYQEIVDNYVQRPGYPDIMNGAWSPFSDPANNGKDGMFFGFWAGEIIRGLSLYSEMLDSID